MAVEQRYVLAMEGLQLESQAATMLNLDKDQGLVMLGVARAILAPLESERIEITNAVLNHPDPSITIPTLSTHLLAKLLELHI